MMQEMQNTDFRRITVDFGAMTSKAHTTLIGHELDKASQEVRDMAEQSVAYIADVITSDLIEQ
jgi:hypothetical protein